MAKIASSKLYGSGKAKTPTKAAAKKESEVSSPVRTSPRRRKSEVSENAETFDEKEVQLEKVKKPGRKPSPPTFSASKKKSAEAKPKSPKTPGRGRRKSALEPVVLTSETVVEAEATNEEEKEETTPDEIDDIFKFFNHASTTEDEEEGQMGERDETNLNLENSPIFEEEHSEPVLEKHSEEVEGLEKHLEEVEGLDEHSDETTPSDEEIAFHFDEDEVESSSEGSNSEALNEEEYNDQFRYNSSNVRLRLSQYFQRQESALSSANSLKNQLWTRMKEWVSESVIPGAKELGEATVEYTKKAIEQIAKRLEKKEEVEVDNGDVSVYEDEPRIYEITEEEQELAETENYMEVDHSDIEEEGDSKRTKLMEEEEDFEVVQNSFVVNYSLQNSQQSSMKSSYHSVPADETLMFTPQKQQPPKAAVYSEVMDSRLTEIVLFFAKCARDTPISSIYEHLEEFFTLKGENSLNLTEKQLISSVIKDFLTEKDESVAVPSVPVYEPVVLLNESPKRVKVLSGSGIRFRAPKFTAEEEARLEEMEQVCQKNLAANNKISTLSTPQQRSKIQRKLLAPEATAELIEGMPENRGRASSNTRNKSDSVSSAIEDIISQKIKEAKQREEAERIETEKLKARVAELERESRERATKEALLQKQLEEQKKELEIEKAAAKEKLETLKSNFKKEPNLKKETSLSVPAASVGFSFGKIDEEKPPSGFSFGESSKAAGVEPSAFKGFSFGGKVEEAKKEESTTVAPFASFSFGAAKADTKTEDSKSEDSKPAVAPFASFSFGKKETSEGGEVNAPAFVKSELPSFGFSFGDSAGVKEDEKVEEKKAAFSFGAAGETKSGFAFGTGASAEGKPASTFSFGSSASASSADKPVTTAVASAPAAAFSFGAGASADKPAATTAFNFGNSGADAGKKEASSAPVFSFGAKPAEKPVFSFGTSEPAKTNVFGTSASEPAKMNVFGSSEPSKANVFGSTEPAKANVFGSFSFGSSPALPSAPSPQPSSTNANNPFAALNSATNIFSSAPPLSSNTFSFGAPAAFPPMPSANAFSFPPVSPSNNPIVPMNFGSSAAQPGANDQPAEMAFQPGARTISIPKRRRK